VRDGDVVPELLVIIPTYNEAGSIGDIVAATRGAVPDAHVLIVDDASPDGTGELADELAAADPAVHVLHRRGKDGLGRAYLAGFAEAIAQGYTFVAEMDADGSHDPAELPAMLALARDGADLVIGSRWVPGGKIENWPRFRQAISRLGNAYARAALRSHIRDITAGFRVIRCATLETTQLERIASHGYGFQIELAWRIESAGGLVVEHPITFVERTAGKSKMHAGIVVEALLRVTGWALFGQKRKPADSAT
jgi:dolichol-phosphate mannosyltransferase